MVVNLSSVPFQIRNFASMYLNSKSYFPNMFFESRTYPSEPVIRHSLIPLIICSVSRALNSDRSFGGNVSIIHSITNFLNFFGSGSHTGRPTARSMIKCSVNEGSHLFTLYANHLSQLAPLKPDSGGPMPARIPVPLNLLRGN